jgi:hypothetical protein
VPSMTALGSSARTAPSELGASQPPVGGPQVAPGEITGQILRAEAIGNVGSAGGTSARRYRLDRDEAALATSRWRLWMRWLRGKS